MIQSVTRYPPPATRHPPPVLCYLVHKPLKKDQYFSSTDLTLVQYHISLEDNVKKYIVCALHDWLKIIVFL